MKNNSAEKNRKIMIVSILFLCFMITGCLSFFQIRYYRKSMFEQFSRICQLLVEEEPEVKKMLISVLKQYEKEKYQEKYQEGNYKNKIEKKEIKIDKNKDILSQYGYRPKNFLIEKPFYVWMIFFLFSLLESICFLFFFFSLEQKKKKRMKELTLYLEKVNFQGTKTMIPLIEDDFSLLQDEIYKTVTNLYQTRDNACYAKKNYADNLANIAHQLKTPISAALLSLQLLKEEVSSSYIEQIQRQLMRLNTLETALLTISHIDSGTLKLAYLPVDVYTALSLARDNLYDLLIEKEITVEIPEHNDVVIFGDMDWTMEALFNIIKNCIEHSPKGGVIYCEYWNNPLYAEICIWDKGKGFAKKDLPHLFERFYRGEYASNHGLGIGLAIAKDIFELQNGTILAKNLPEQGACFEIRIYHKK